MMRGVTAEDEDMVKYLGCVSFRGYQDPRRQLDELVDREADLIVRYDVDDAVQFVLEVVELLLALFRCDCFESCSGTATLLLSSRHRRTSRDS